LLVCNVDRSIVLLRTFSTATTVYSTENNGQYVVDKMTPSSFIDMISIVIQSNYVFYEWTVSATYGLTPTGRKQRLEWINGQLSKIQYLEHTKRQGIGNYRVLIRRLRVLYCLHLLALTGNEVVFLKNKASLLSYRDILTKAPTCFIDVRAKLQLLCDQVLNYIMHII
jgi:hypothetical protein